MTTNAKLLKLLSMINDVITETYMIRDELLNKYKKKTEEYFEYIAESAVDDFYGGYNPGSSYVKKVKMGKNKKGIKRQKHAYDRTGDLYNAYKVVVNDDEWAIYFGPEFMQHNHHQSNEIIYNVAFEYGYHGGSGQTVSDSKAPWWRTPYPFYPNWLAPAVGEGISPKEAIEELYNTYMDNIEKIMQDEFDSAMNALLLPILKQARSL